MPTRRPPTTLWGALHVAAGLLEASPGLARLATISRDYKAGKLSVPAALQDALWPPPEPLPRVDMGIPQHDPADYRCALYWRALQAVDEHCGGCALDFSETPQATAATVAAMMRDAARADSAASP